MTATTTPARARISPAFGNASWSALVKLSRTDPIIDMALLEWAKQSYAGEPDAFLLMLVARLSERNAELQGLVADAMVRGGQ